MDKYYYFASSLPMLSWEGKMPLAMDDFVSDCQRLLGEEDYCLIRHLLKGQGEEEAVKGHPAYRAWTEKARRFHNELVFYRANKIHRDPQGFIRGTRYPDPYFKEMLDDAAKAPHPLASEKKIDFMWWQMLEEMTANHYFDFEYIMGYALKLKILERWQAIHSSRGKEIFDSFSEEIIKKSREKLESAA